MITGDFIFLSATHSKHAYPTQTFDQV